MVGPDPTIYPDRSGVICEPRARPDRRCVAGRVRPGHDGGRGRRPRSALVHTFVAVSRNTTRSPAMPDGTAQWGLLVPSVFFGLHNDQPALGALQTLARIGDVGDPRGPWFMADNLITYGHTR